MSRYGKGKNKNPFLTVPLSTGSVLIRPMNVAAAITVKGAQSRYPVPPVVGDVLEDGAWDNMSGEHSEGEFLIPPEPAWHDDIEELLATNTVAPPMPELRSGVPAWEFSPLEAMRENTVKRSSKNTRKGRGFRTRKRKTRRGGRRRKYRHTA
jgi:hypothetical protein